MPEVVGGYCNLGEERDRTDAEAIRLTILSSALVMQYGVSAPNRQAREAIFHFWQRPRIPKAPRVGSQYEASLLWSEAAIAVGRSGKTSGRLVREHLVPISILVAQLNKRHVDDPDGFNTDVVLEELRRSHRHALCVILTKDEDVALNKAGLRARTPDIDAPWSRYEGLGLHAENLKPYSASQCLCVATSVPD